ncbi:MAG: phosphoribosylformylglycinamidine synthase I [Chloroflexi bacterium HGW-Chloroflexi-4]|jgi:phosphoribosylformylglycinamidine synthase|nr:MAG: phosphoribosylformylglycinamidine synthase I [Chloroflexi bacterium HGW-Chloroflexi-4]
MKPSALILFAPGTNRDGDVAQALSLAGASSRTIPLKTLRDNKIDWADHQILVLPGGFSYADALGAGKLLALDLSHYFIDQVQAFVAAGKPVIGICNGFQVLVKSGILPGNEALTETRTATLTHNQGNHFECRWVSLKPVSQKCLWTKNLTEIIDCPVAHGEGNFTLTTLDQAKTLSIQDQIALVYVHSDGKPAGGVYPVNPNGSVMDIAGICNPQGNVLGLMPHPEDHVFPFQSPDRIHRPDASGLPLFINGVRYASES